MFFDADAGRHCEQANVVGNAGRFRRDEVSQALVRTSDTIDHRLFGLLARAIVGERDFGTRVIGIDFDIVVINGIGRQQRNHTVRCQPAPLDQLVQHRAPLFIDLAGCVADYRIFQDGREWASQVPSLEKWSPIDILRNGRQIVVTENAAANKFGLDGSKLAREIEFCLVRARGRQRHHRCRLLVRMLRADALVISLDVVNILFTLFRCQQRLRHRYRA